MYYALGSIETYCSAARLIAFISVFMVLMNLIWTRPLARVSEGQLLFCSDC